MLNQQPKPNIEKRKMLRRRRETEPGEKRVKVAAVGDGSKGDEAKRVRAVRYL